MATRAVPQNVPVNRPVTRREESATLDPVETDAPAKPARRPRAKKKSRDWSRVSRAASRVLSVLTALVVLVGSVALGRVGHRWLLSTPRFAASDIEVQGTAHATRDEVLRAAHIGATRNVLSIDAETAARAIETLPWVSRATVHRRLPNHVQIVVEERQAAALVAAAGLYLASPDGTLFKRVAPGDPVDLPIITGIDRAEFESDPASAREGVRDALALLADLDAATVGRALRVEEVHREITGELSLMVGPTYVWLGRGPYRAKLTRLRVVLAELRRRGLDATEVHLESDRHPERVTVRPQAMAVVAGAAR